ncbi:MAG: hypothetical protein JEY94_12885 [Melioribacteraceae bacterium]|nr:hypothetical protein [Melioribacteraceae bacterium]
MSDKYVSKGRIIFGLGLILIGILFLLDNWDIMYFNLPFALFQWETFFIILGLSIVLLTNNKPVGIVFLLLGIFGLFPKFWPLILVVLGIYLILNKNRSLKYDILNRSIEDIGDKADQINDISIFGGGNKMISKSNFRGGKVTAIFGGSEIDLTNCKLAKGNQIIDIVLVFGGTSFFVPKDWNVIIDIIPLFGGFSDSRRKNPVLAIDEEKTLIIRGVTMFGGGEVKSY